MEKTLSNRMNTMETSFKKIQTLQNGVSLEKDSISTRYAHVTLSHEKNKRRILSTICTKEDKTNKSSNIFRRSRWIRFGRIFVGFTGFGWCWFHGAEKIQMSGRIDHGELIILHRCHELTSEDRRVLRTKQLKTREKDSFDCLPERSSALISSPSRRSFA